ncbi:MAG: hypothetical protein ABF624_00845 [Liquorilactobacillus ghanensis]|uniref:phage tail assembly chaperone G n=1 Tax=Liquorilactobacillus ghanensis TaxID=399370 RepID=UPI0039ECDE92
MAKIAIKLRDKNGKIKTYEQMWVPTRKLLEAMEITSDNYPNIIDMNHKQVDFIASLFDQEEVTADAIMDGVAAWKFNEFVDGVLDQLMGIDPNSQKEEESQETKPKV